METEKSRSESPFSKSKTKSHLSDSSEIGNAITEQIKIKKKSLRNKTKPQANGKENEEVTNNGKDFYEEEEPTQNDTDKNVNSDNADHENGIENGNSPENSKENEEIPNKEVTDNKEHDAFISICKIPEEKNVIEFRSTTTENSVECKSTENITTANVEESFTEQCSELETMETENNIKNNNSAPSDLMPEEGVILENFEEICNENENDLFNKKINITVKEQEITENCPNIKESSWTSINASDSSLHIKEANATEDRNQSSPNSAIKDDLSVSIKITSFLGKWGYSQEQKQESEVSSTKKVDDKILNQFDLSKVSGRPGIKDRLNSSAAVFSSKEMEMKTPESSQMSLDDSFRVRTNPPRLNSSRLEENPTLRKFKGKRCLNAESEPEEEDDIYFNTMKKRKIDEKNQDSGFLGSILWSPFKKKSYENKNQLKLANAESKLSRLLSPFWFWKKTGTEQGDK